jgi:hypothetical protein
MWWFLHQIISMEGDNFHGDYGKINNITLGEELHCILLIELGRDIFHISFIIIFVSLCPPRFPPKQENPSNSFVFILGDLLSQEPLVYWT